MANYIDRLESKKLDDLRARKEDIRKAQTRGTQEWKDVQQPIAKDGYTNNDYDRIYGKNHNRFRGTERDRDQRKKYF